MPDDPEFSTFMREFVEAEAAKKTVQRKPITPKKYDFDPAKFPDIPTSNELSTLIDNRATPAPAPAPGGLSAGTVSQVDAAFEREREERIEFLRERLGQRQETFEQDFDDASGLDS